MPGQLAPLPYGLNPGLRTAWPPAIIEGVPVITPPAAFVNPILILPSNLQFVYNTFPWTALGGSSLSQAVDPEHNTTWSMLVTGPPGSPGAQSELIPVTAGGNYYSIIYVTCPQGWGNVQVSIYWTNNVGASVGTPAVSQQAVLPNIRTVFVPFGTAPVGAVNAQIQVQAVGIPSKAVFSGTYGAYVNPRDYGLDPTDNSTYIDLLRTIALYEQISTRAIGCRKIYAQPGVVPPDADSMDILTDIDANRRVLLVLYPPANPTTNDALTTLSNFLNDCVANGVSASQMDICLFDEPFRQGLSASQYIAMVQFYGPTIRRLGFPLVYCQNNWDVVHLGVNSTYYPGDAYVDKIAVNYYCNDFIYGAGAGGHTLNTAQSQADKATTPWNITVSGTPAANNYFITGQANASIIFPGQQFQENGAGTVFTITSVGAPFGGFINVFFTPNASSPISNPNTVVNTRLAIPFSLWAVGYNLPSDGQQSVVAFLQYVQSFMSARFAAGKAVGDVCHMSTAQGPLPQAKGPPGVALYPEAAPLVDDQEFVIPYLQLLCDAVTSTSSGQLQLYVAGISPG